MNILEARRRTLGKGVYKKTVEGNPAIAQGSLARMYPGIVMNGWTTQDGTPTPEAPVPIVSAGKYNEETQKYEYRVKLTGANLFNPDGEIVKGSPYAGIPLNNKGIASMSLYEKNPDVDLSNIYFGICSEELNANNVAWAIGNGAIQAGGKIIVREDNTYVCWCPGNDTVLQKVLSRYDVMVNYGDGVYLPYQPYKEQTVTLTADRPLTKWDRLEKRNGQWGWVYKSAEINITDESPLRKYGADKISLYVSDAYLFGIPYCEKYVCQNGVPATENRIGLSSGSHAFVIYDTRYLDNVESYKQWLSENPLTLWYETTEETFVPLSESEQEAMNALYTFRPTTVLSNDCECEMSLTYKTKKSLEVTT